MALNNHTVPESDIFAGIELESFAPTTADGDPFLASQDGEQNSDSSITEVQSFAENNFAPKQAEFSVLHRSSGWHLLLPELLNLVFATLFWGMKAPRSFAIPEFLQLGTVLAISIISLKDKPESPWATKVVEATRIAPSLWPVLFAVILGNAIKCYARWRAENGIALGVCMEHCRYHFRTNLTSLVVRTPVEFANLRQCGWQYVHTSKFRNLDHAVPSSALDIQSFGLPSFIPRNIIRE